MKKNSNNAQTLKSGENCDKYSKSVSYEILVVGTATTGTGYKQIRRLFLSSADKPLSAVGTLTSLLCNSAKVVEKWLQISHDLKNDNKSEKRGKTEVCAGYRFCKTMRFLYKNLVDYLLQTLPVFRLIKILCLLAVLSVGITAESQADDVIPTSGTCNSDGTCLWSLGSDGTLTISAKNGAKDVEMANYNCTGNPCKQSTLRARPWETQINQIKSIYIGDNITKIGQDAFQNASNLQSVTGMKDVNTIGGNAVFGYTGLTGFTMPDSLTNISSSIFINSKVLTELIIPDNLIDNNVVLSDVMFSNSCFSPAYASTRPSCANAKIVCQGDVEKCKNALAKFGGNGNCTVDYCIDSNKIVAANYQQCSGNYFWNGAECVREPDVSKRKCCSDVCKDMGGWCNRIRYTPAEAAKVLHDDNNEITITFKK